MHIRSCTVCFRFPFVSERPKSDFLLSLRKEKQKYIFLMPLSLLIFFLRSRLDRVYICKKKAKKKISTATQNVHKYISAFIAFYFFFLFSYLLSSLNYNHNTFPFLPRERDVDVGVWTKPKQKKKTYSAYYFSTWYGGCFFLQSRSIGWWGKERKKKLNESPLPQW